jgi:hypothetical protein
MMRQYGDSSQPNWRTGKAARPEATIIWYAAAASARRKPICLGSREHVRPIPVIDDAPVLQNGAKYPLVLLSHGATFV